MTLEQTTELYASVLRQLLPVGGYDASPNTEALAVDVYAHAKLLAHADLDAKRLLNVLEGIPSELIAEYETEYGLPLKCTVNASRTVEERLQILNWVRTSRNVLNRAYLEQILAIFGVTLIDIQKFRPILCTASCTDPVNTEQMRYKVFLRLQYPVNADLNCIIENYLPGYLRFDWMVDMPWGDWIVNSGVTVNTNGIAHYTAYKTNQREYYDSYANLDLTQAIVLSLHDADMQQWQAVKDAIYSLANTATYTFKNDQVEYTTTDPNSGPYSSILRDSIQIKYYGKNRQQACELYAATYGYTFNYLVTFNNVDFYCEMASARIGVGYTASAYTYITKNLSYLEIAQKIISNTTSSNQAISLLAETYVEAVANSISNADESKQFVKLSDLTGQFELNKTLRT